MRMTSTAKVRKQSTNHDHYVFLCCTQNQKTKVRNLVQVYGYAEQEGEVERSTRSE